MNEISVIKIVSQKFALTIITLVASMVFAPSGLAETGIDASGFVENKIVANGRIITAGVTPDSAIWPLDVAMDRIALLLTFDANAKAHKSLDIARERLLEVREMVIQNRIDASAKAEAEHKIMLKVAEESSVKMRTDKGKTNALLEIENELEDHEEEIADVKNDIHIKVKVEGKFTEEQQNAIENFMQKILNSTGEVKLKIDIKVKGNLTAEQNAAIDELASQFEGNGEVKFRLKVNAIASKIALDAEEEFDSLLGLPIDKKEVASDRLEDAKEAFNELKIKIAELNGNNITIKASGKVLFEESQRHLLKAETAYIEKEYGEAYGQATATLRLAGNAKVGIEGD